jgi:hypothetical protein
MTTAQLVLIIGLVVIAAILIAVILMRGSRRRDEQRVEAEELRSEAQGVMATMTGQTAFAQQADERADVARTEAEEAAREAERLENEAAEQHRTAEASRQEYETMMRRADDIDPDVKESEFPPVREEQAAEPTAAAADDEATPGTTDTEPSGAGDRGTEAEEDAPMTRAERRRVREEAEAQEAEGAGTGDGAADEESSWASGPPAPVAGAAGAAAVGTAVWASRDDDATDEERERSSRIASADDYRDDTSASDVDDRQEAADHHDDTTAPTGGTGRPDPADQFDVWAEPAVGTAAGMSQSSHDDVTDSDTDGYEAERADVAADAAADAESPRGEWGGPREGEDTGADRAAGTDHPTTEEDTMSQYGETDERADDGLRDAEDHHEDGIDGGADGAADAEGTTDAGDGASGLTMVADPDSYASTEPVLAADQAPPVEPPQTEHSGTGLLGEDTGTGGEGAAEDADDEDLPTAGATPDEHTTLDEAENEDTDAVILADTDRYATTEPQLADGSSAAPREEWEAGRDGDAHITGSDVDHGEDTADDSSDEAADGIVAADAADDEARDWGRSEGDRLEENRERGEQLAADREALDREAAGEEPGAGYDEPVGATADDSSPMTEDHAADSDATAPAEDSSPAEEAPRGRRVSDFHEIRDGGFGVGSAAPLEDGGQPMDHPIAGYRDTMSFRTPDDAGYDDAEPDVWFYDEGAAERSGFHRSDG